MERNAMILHRSGGREKGDEGSSRSGKSGGVTFIAGRPGDYAATPPRRVFSSHPGRPDFATRTGTAG